MNWYLVMSKPREEDRAYENLVYQQYNCYLPKVKIEKIKQAKKIQLLEPLFPRYLFVSSIQALIIGGRSAQLWAFQIWFDLGIAMPKFPIVLLRISTIFPVSIKNPFLKLVKN